MAFCHISKGRFGMAMQLETRVFELCNGKYKNIKGLARAMGVSWQLVYGVRKGKCRINQTFIIGATKAFPGYKLDDLFYVALGDLPASEAENVNASRCDKVVKLRNAGLSYAEIGRRLGVSREWARQIIKGNPPLRKPDLQSRVMLTTRDVAQLLGLHPNTVRRWNKKGILESYRITPRGDRRFRREDVDDFLKEVAIEQ
jgi:excisionase family DNA binding protein